MSITTDHSRATLAGAHSDGAVPNASRADRPTSFDPDDFAVPTGREENWRFSPVRQLKAMFANEGGEGHLAWETSSLPDGVTFTEVSRPDAMARSVRAPGDRASAIAVARSGGAMALTIAPGITVAEPITVTLTGNGDDVRGHVLFELGERSEATVVVERRGSAVYSEFVSVDVADGATLNLVLTQQWADDAVHVGEVVARLGKDANLRGTVVTLGGKVVRLNTSVAFAGEGGRVDLFGLYFADAGQHQEHLLGQSTRSQQRVSRWLGQRKDAIFPPDSHEIGANHLSHPHRLRGRAVGRSCTPRPSCAKRARKESRTCRLGGARSGPGAARARAPSRCR